MLRLLKRKVTAFINKYDETKQIKDNKCGTRMETGMWQCDKVIKRGRCLYKNKQK